MGMKQVWNLVFDRPRGRLDGSSGGSRIKAKGPFLPVRADFLGGGRKLEGSSIAPGATPDPTGSKQAGGWQAAKLAPRTVRSRRVA
jgi:hypothetical protein